MILIFTFLCVTMKRRAFLKMLSGLPFVGYLQIVPKANSCKHVNRLTISDLLDILRGTPENHFKIEIGNRHNLPAIINIRDYLRLFVLQEYRLLKRNKMLRSDDCEGDNQWWVMYLVDAVGYAQVQIWKNKQRFLVFHFTVEDDAIAIQCVHIK